jgi:la-related protein 1
MYLRRKMDSQGFVSLEFIAGFNRIKHLSTDLELIKLVCQQSNIVQYRTGEDGQDRLRRKEGWEQWVLNMSDRDAVAQNEGPKELHQPPVPHPASFDSSSTPQWPISAVEPAGPYVGNGSFSPMNGYSHGSDQDNGPVADSMTNGTANEGSSEAAIPNGHPVETSTKAVSSEPDFFSDVQTATFDGHCSHAGLFLEACIASFRSKNIC